MFYQLEIIGSNKGRERLMDGHKFCYGDAFYSPYTDNDNRMVTQLHFLINGSYNVESTFFESMSSGELDWKTPVHDMHTMSRLFPGITFCLEQWGPMETRMSRSYYKNNMIHRVEGEFKLMEFDDSIFREKILNELLT